jgi:hypothetical protein
MDDEADQVRRVAEAARRLREHQLSILGVLGAGDFERQEWNDRSVTLCVDLDAEITTWRTFDR